MNNKVRVTAALAVLALVSGCGVFKGGGKKTPTCRRARADPGVGERHHGATRRSRRSTCCCPKRRRTTAGRQPGGNASKSMGHLALGASPARTWIAGRRRPSKRTRLAASPVVSENKLYRDRYRRRRPCHGGRHRRRIVARQHRQGATGTSRRASAAAPASRASARYATNGLGDVVAIDAADGNVCGASVPAVRCAARQASPTAMPMW